MPPRSVPFLVAHHPQDATDVVDDLETPEGCQRAPYVPLARHVSEEDQPCFVAQSHLFHRPDRHAVVTEHPGYGGEHAGTIDDVDVQVPGTAQVIGRPELGTDKAHE